MERVESRTEGSLVLILARRGLPSLYQPTTIGVKSSSLHETLDECVLVQDVDQPAQANQTTNFDAENSLYIAST